MGRCLAFNFGPSELQSKLSGVRYFVYSPDFEGPGGHQPQNFYATIDLSAMDAKSVSDQLNPPVNSRLSFYSPKNSSTLIISLTSLDSKGAISDGVIDDVMDVDAQLARMGLTIDKNNMLERRQDVVVADTHLLVGELSKPFERSSGVHVPRRNEWHVGSSFEEANAKYEAIENR